MVHPHHRLAESRGGISLPLSSRWLVGIPIALSPTRCCGAPGIPHVGNPNAGVSSGSAYLRDAGVLRSAEREHAGCRR